MFDNKILMITGGTGSFGKTVLNRFLNSDVREIVIFSRDEKKQEDMRTSIQSSRVRFVLGDVRDYNSLSLAMNGVDYVFHAAALKQVPSCEFFPMEAVNTNIVGTDNVISAATAAGVKRVILLSTDKAVYPINAMGISKSMAEKILIARARRIGDGDGPVLCATRYGNVMASRGSVIPLFVEKIKACQPLRITNPVMTRFLMSLEDSVNLVLHAFEHGRQGDIFVQKAPACTVGDLATALRMVFDSDVPTEIIGSRHGEKLHETLISREELAKAVDMGRYYRIPADNRDLNYQEYTDLGNVETDELADYTSGNTHIMNVDEVVEALLGLAYIKAELSLRLKS
jgi:UDP-N-acetylglucosamine 4,6-dehydratase/5-epimerase